MQSDGKLPDDEPVRMTDEALDELLRQAEWPEATPLQLGRLEREWDRLRPRRRTWQSMRWAAFAASLLVGTVIWQALPREADNLAINPQPHHPSVVPLPPSSPPRLVVEVRPDEQPNSERRASTSIGRPATNLEVALTNVAIRRAEREQERIAADPFERWVARISEDDQLAIIDFDESDEARQELLQRSLFELPRSQGQRRIAIAKLLTLLELPEAQPALLALWAEAYTRDAVEAHLVEVVDVPTLMEMSRARLTFSEQVRFLSRIAERPDVEAQRLLLLAAMTDQYRRAAMIVTRETHLPPADMLFEALADQNADVRFAAALLLGEIDDPRITDRLIEIARNGPRQSDPWVALIRRRDTASRQLIAEARSDPNISSTLLTAELARQSTLTPIQWGAAL
ncbi:MAG: HEAT repeat domain-containing protein [Planctomycetaceae bacterium]|nr:HEAT repeat domain-containing protein [Planctomycetaceae bacterium]